MERMLDRCDRVYRPETGQTGTVVGVTNDPLTVVTVFDDELMEPPKWLQPREVVHLSSAHEQRLELERLLDDAQRRIAQGQSDLDDLRRAMSSGDHDAVETVADRLIPGTSVSYRTLYFPNGVVMPEESS